VKPQKIKVKAAPVPELLKILQTEYADAQCSLTYKNPYELAVATILSAQCTDERVNKVTPALFKKFPSTKELAKASQTEVEKLVASTGFFRNKAKNLIGMASDVEAKHSGKIPETMEELSNLPGIGRKTANVVLGNAFGKPAGVVVDTHVKRLCFRLGLTKSTDPTKIEFELNEMIPSQYWTELPHWLIQHGRKICTARSAQCKICPLAQICPQKGVKKL